MNGVTCERVFFPFQLGDWILFRVSLPLQVRRHHLRPDAEPVPVPPVPSDALIDGSQGFAMRSLPVTGDVPSISRVDRYICYAPLEYEHCYVDLLISFEDYKKTFSSKTRATIQRKVRKYTEHCGGTLPWKAYKTPTEIGEFLPLARSISKKTYQERLFDAGIPESADFARQAEGLAAQNKVRAYILFDGTRPVSYLYCPVQDDVVIYAYLGYDPEYTRLSVGTVLQWIALEDLYLEARFRYFDFTEGYSEHKRLFSTHQRRCANVFLVRKTVRNTVLVYAHFFTNRFSHWAGNALDRLGFKERVRRAIRLYG